MILRIYKSCFFILITLFVSVGLNAQNYHKTKHENRAFFLFKTWYITPVEKKTDKSKRKFIAMPSEKQTTISINADGSAKLDFLKMQTGSWNYDADKKILTLSFPKETLKWRIVDVNANAIKYQDVSKEKPVMNWLVKV